MEKAILQNLSCKKKDIRIDFNGGNAFHTHSITFRPKKTSTIKIKC